MFSRPAHRRVLTVLSVAAAAALLAGCTASPPSSGEKPDPVVIGHIHSVVAENDETILVGAHSGLFRVTTDGDVEGPVDGSGFDVMGLTASEGVLIASGHPGPNTPAELGSPHLGIVRSEDGGERWEPAAFTGVEDFHVLAAGPDGQVYGIGSTSPAVRISADQGISWTSGTEVSAADLAVTKDGTIYAATQEGVLASTDQAASFAPVADAPLLYLLEAAGDELVGVDTEGKVWKRGGDAAWTPISSGEGTVVALGLAPGGTVYIVDDQGIVAIDGEDATVILPMS